MGALAVTLACMMEGDLDRIDVEAVARRHRRLWELARETSDQQVQAILVLAAAVLLHGELEAAHLGPVLRLVDPAVRRELALEHERLAEDVAYLQELRQDEAGSPDVPALAAAIRSRILAHLERDERALYRPMRRLAQVM